jgi:RND family efflux transporter MFP subunit
VTISDPSRLRVTVYVDQSEAPNVHVGTPAEVVDASNSVRQGTGKVARVAGELDTKTRTQLTEVDFDNSKGEFIPGSFVNVNLLLPTKSYVEVPAPALIMREGKRMVAVIGPDSRVKFTPINVAGTDGKVIRIESGLEENVRVALNLPNTVADGAKVTAAGAPPAQVPAATAAASSSSAGGKSASGGPITPAPK